MKIVLLHELQQIERRLVVFLEGKSLFEESLRVRPVSFEIRVESELIEHLELLQFFIVAIEDQLEVVALQLLVHEVVLLDTPQLAYLQEGHVSLDFLDCLYLLGDQVELLLEVHSYVHFQWVQNAPTLHSRKGIFIDQFV